MRKWLMEKRKKQQLTQEEVSIKAHINRAYYSQIESGTRNPSMEVAKNIATVLNFSPFAFFMNENTEPFHVALKNAPIVIAHCDLDLRYTWLYNPHADFEQDASIGKTDLELDDNEGTRALMELKKEVIETKRQIHRKICFPLSTGEICYSVFAEPLLNQQGQITGIVTASMEMID
ncbi:helix-turn-helix domain-containing protein [Paenisporosarcina cavernae]|uniref:Helix-turn-helix domain-containing protein n=1 Tax=Paenisporosarcina cavernae TaxID=2320858 RepID=A0A385YXZ8_9BACL|nr:helix-turn-helix domain-containing protein [Paenisporosarcina cavernae]AYC30332.1 helix-turn-helix domain-containing protein [Paenisporosarcina cavernae]